MDDKPLFQCPECGLHYQALEAAKECEAFCKEHLSCSLDITSHSVERKAAKESS